MFPTFSWYSTPLFSLYILGFGFSIAILTKYFYERKMAYLLLATILLIYTLDRTTYTIGFMGWYDQFPNTKINYFILNFNLLFGPLIYLYVRNITDKDYNITGTQWLHFVPFILYVAIRMAAYIHDIHTEGIDDVQNGPWFKYIFMGTPGFFLQAIITISILLYLFWSVHTYLVYKKELTQLYSNTYEMELNWLRNFLIVFTSFFVLFIVVSEIAEDVLDLGYKEYWWGHLMASISMIYLGIYGFRFNVNKLHDALIKLPQLKTPAIAQINFDPEKKEQLKVHFQKEKPYLDANLSLKDLAKQMQMHPNDLSRLINDGFNQNFNEFVNQFRVMAVTDAINQGKAQELTLLAIAYESGFNSKATFNRIFKKVHHVSPSAYLKSKMN